MNRMSTIVRTATAVLVLLSQSSHAIEPIKVLLAKTSTTVSDSVVRSALIQMNTTMGNSGLGSFDFVAADLEGTVPVVDIAFSCNQSVPADQLSCLKSVLEGRRNAVNADIVVAVAPLVGGLCGSVNEGMINPGTIDIFYEFLGYAVLKQNCITEPSNGQRIASHEVGHLLYLEHHDDDPATNLPAGFSHNHAEEDFDDHTVMGDPKDDCIDKDVNCNGHDFFSETGRTFPDGGSAGGAFSNAKRVVLTHSWLTVAAYRPRPQAGCDARTVPTNVRSTLTTQCEAGWSVYRVLWDHACASKVFSYRFSNRQMRPIHTNI